MRYLIVQIFKNAHSVLQKFTLKKVYVKLFARIFVNIAFTYELIGDMY